MTETPEPTGLVPKGWRSVAAQINVHAAGDPDRRFVHSLDDGRSLSWGALAEHARLPKDDLTRSHRRDGFEAGNADRIFESTYTSQTDRESK